MPAAASLPTPKRSRPFPFVAQLLLGVHLVDLDVDAGSDWQNFQFVNRIESWVEKIENTDVGSHLKLLARLAVYVR